MKPTPDNFAGDFSGTLQRASRAAAAGRLEDAKRLFEVCHSVRPDSVAAHVGMGHVLRAMGAAAGAIASYRAAIALSAGCGAAWWGLANLKTYRFPADEMTALQAVARTVTGATLDEVLLQFAAAQAMEQAHGAAAAFPGYRRANAAMKALTDYRSADDQALMESLRAAVRPLDSPLSGQGQEADLPKPIFIVGVPRSGSTLVEQIIGSHPAVGGGGELPHLGAMVARQAAAAGLSVAPYVAGLAGDAARKLAAAYRDAIAPHAGGRPYVIDKQLNNFWLVAAIVKAFPDSAIIDVRRHPVDCSYSQFKQAFVAGHEHSYDLGDIARHYRIYAAMMQHWDAVFPGRVTRVFLEDLTADLSRQSRRLAAAAGLEWCAAMARPHDARRAVQSASSEQVRQPVYASRPNQWARTAPELSGLRAMLAHEIETYPGGQASPSTATQ